METNPTGPRNQPRPGRCRQHRNCREARLEEQADAGANFALPYAVDYVKRHRSGTGRVAEWFKAPVMKFASSSSALSNLVSMCLNWLAFCAGLVLPCRDHYVLVPVDSGPILVHTTPHTEDLGHGGR